MLPSGSGKRTRPQSCCYNDPRQHELNNGNRTPTEFDIRNRLYLFRCGGTPQTARDMGLALQCPPTKVLALLVMMAERQEVISPDFPDHPSLHSTWSLPG